MAEGSGSCDIENDSCNQDESNDPSSKQTSDKNGKREHNTLMNSSTNTNHVLPNNNESIKKMKTISDSDSCSPNTFRRSSRRSSRNYRPHRVESSSSSENESNEVDSKPKNDNHNLMPFDKLSNNQNDLDDPTSNNNEGVSLSSSSGITSQSNSNSNSVISERLTNNERPVSSPMQTSESTSGTQNEDGNAVRSPSLSRRVRRFFSSFPLNSDSDEDDSDDDSESGVEEGGSENSAENKASQKLKRQERINKDVDDILNKTVPGHCWNSLQEITYRQYGMSANRQAPTLFKNRFYDSLHLVQRLDLATKLDFHSGCVNALSFSEDGELLASGSDDFQIAIWDWKRKQPKVTYNSGHRNNVFQCKFLPHCGGTYIVSCARDGQVRLSEITSSGVVRDTRRLAKHSRTAHKLTTRNAAPYEIMSAGEDAFVFNIDIRAGEPDKVVLVKDVQGNRVPLYSIHQHPLNDNQFCVSGQDQYVRVYDRRIISSFGPPVLKFCPPHLVGSKCKPSVTCAVYSSTGDGILASYSDEDIYIFDPSQSEAAEPAHRYSGHRNSSTVKGVNFLSPSSNFVVSGSDCGNVFFWHRNTEALVKCVKGDDNGVVNVLEPHPHLPMMATSGLDNEVKLWFPTPSAKQDLNEIQKTVRSNMVKRARSEYDPIDTQVLMMMFQHMHHPFNSRSRRQRVSATDADGDEGDMNMLDDSSDSSSDSAESDEEVNGPGPDLVQCSTQ